MRSLDGSLWPSVKPSPASPSRRVLLSPSAALFPSGRPGGQQRSLGELRGDCAGRSPLRSWDGLCLCPGRPSGRSGPLRSHSCGAIPAGDPPELSPVLFALAESNSSSSSPLPVSTIAVVAGVVTTVLLLLITGACCLWKRRGSGGRMVEDNGNGPGFDNITLRDVRAGLAALQPGYL